MGKRPAAMTQAEFARHRGVSKAIVTKWKGQGLLSVNAAGLVEVEATEWNLDQRPANYRGGTVHRPIRALPKDDPDPRERSERRAEPPNPAPQRPSDPDTEPDYDPDDPDLPLPLALQRKENYLGLFRRQEVLKNDRRLVDRAAAEALFFDTARDLRDAWAAWPARVAIEMAEELHIDARMLATVLTAHVNTHLAELGEPHPDGLG